ncbi:hypothetical protein FAN42_19945 [Salmonella enterica]|uniref:Uncharacterized protein n=2 Tax=Salmonella enterica TaxID=28901 RepID=A0A746IQM5_SALER|nr:hypothetical protein [Salmonella enterica]EAW2051752.1 hypothetical protein [Salmonella enterica subsp. enterica]EBS0320005.1 hypothetical protein [Salmonella enterica subsp. enterica serovar Enteritidis]ECG2749670.1 hypothetical protein [Salmonella enterica subsp. enterica serovar Typhi]EEM2973840.1 hypothetical protein [Salmonella enterica subsp. enterica serovar Dublin]
MARNKQASRRTVQATADGYENFVARVGMQAQIADKDKLIADLKDALLKLQEQNDSLQAQITSARTGGNGAKDAKESKPANSK